MLPTSEIDQSSPVNTRFSLAERLFQSCGIVVFVALIAAGGVSPDPPSHGSPDDALAAFYRQHTGGVSTGALLWDIAMMALILFSVALKRVSERSSIGSRTSQHFFQIAGPLPLFSAVTATLFIVSQALGAAAGTIAVHATAPFGIRALDEGSHLTAHLATLPLGCLIACASLAQKTARTSALWIAWLGIISGITLIVTASWIAIGLQRIHDAGVVGLLLFLVWSLSSSISLLRKKDLF